MTRHYAQDGTVGGVLSRLESLSYVVRVGQGGTFVLGESTVYAAQYTYLGAGTIVRVDHPQVGDPEVTGGLTLNYDPDNDNTYAGWDRFGRVINQTWTVDGDAVDSYLYEYDRNSNRTARFSLDPARLVNLPG